MTTFDARESAFENKFAHDENLKFAATARACRRVALWVARHLGKSREDADKYAKIVALCDLQEPGHDDFLNRLSQDLRGRIPDAELHSVMTEEVSAAMNEIRSDPNFNPA